MKKFLQILIVVAVLLVVGIAGFGYWLVNKIKANEEVTYKENPEILSDVCHEKLRQNYAPASIENPQTFDYTLFQKPTAEYRPWTRWWWPGNDVMTSELGRELLILAEQGFGGVEIQPFDCGLNKDADPEEREKVLSFDTPSFYDHVEYVMRQAQKLGLKVDMTVGTGWPSGGPHVGIDDALRTLAYSETSIEGGQAQVLELPLPKESFNYRFFSLAELSLKGNINSFYGTYAKPLKLLAFQKTGGGRAENPLNLSSTVLLNPASTIDLSTQLPKQNKTFGQEGFNRKVSLKLPKGSWHLITVYEMPEGECPILSAQKEEGLVLNHFDSTTARGHFNYLLGRRSGLMNYYGQPFRAFFNDSYEFKTDRHFSANFLAEFQKRRGYDLSPYLPVVLGEGMDNYFFDHWGFKRRPAFGLNAQDERIRNDYQQTVSDLFIEQYLQTSHAWAQKRGLLSRSQTYGMSIDIMRACGTVHIPETEQLYAGGSDLFLKMVTSGAMLYNKPLVTAESVVFMDRDYMTTPQKTKVAIDKLLASGVNQAIFHGTPYRKTADEYTFTGWTPFSSQFINTTFSSNYSEADPFWKYQKRLNDYIARGQYLMRLGKAKADVLIYYPYMGFSSNFMTHEAHQEFLLGGAMPGVEPPASKKDGLVRSLTTMIDTEENPRNAWLEQVWQMTRKLEAQGITWAWVNDESLQNATVKTGQISIRGNEAQAVVLPNIQDMPLATAKALAQLHQAQAKVLFVGNKPAKSRGFHEYQNQDKALNEVLKSLPNTSAQPKTWGLTSAVPFQNASVLGMSVRHLANSGKVIFLYNPTQQTHENLLNIPMSAHWLDMVSGKGYEVNRNSAKQIVVRLKPYESMALLVGEYGIEAEPLNQNLEKLVISLPKWHLVANQFDFGIRPLFDWRKEKLLKYSMEEGVYDVTFNLSSSQISKTQRSVLDLGQVCYAADVVVNDKPMGKAIISPFEIDITEALQVGKNKIEVRTQPNLRNFMLDRGDKGAKAFKQFKGKKTSLMAQGLLGPVRIYTK